jgi:proline racemase
MKANFKPEKYEHVFRTIETHTLGEYTRVVIDGFPDPPGKTMIDKKNYLRENCDDYRKALIFEPKGHHDMFGSIITSPVHEGADAGVIFMDNEGYLNMCGHGTIGTSTALVEGGLVEAKEPYTDLVLDAPAGIVRARVEVRDGKAVSVTFRNVPAFMYEPDVEMEVDGIKVKFDITFGGSFFVLVNAEQFGKKIDKADLDFFVKMGNDLRRAVNEKMHIQHPELDITTVDVAEFYAHTDSEGCDMQNVVIFGDGMVDRSPCGTGTCAKLAALAYRNELGENEPFVYESIIGSRFTGRYVGRTKVGSFDAVIPQVTGAAYLNGVSTFVLDQDDPLKYGFKLW